ncbi:VanZ like family protein [Amphibacillus marinus]|uniref:VanZ like family protein n=1 Tax=Amphibacillus marinus TaxID=872970 RepID=A0A1H8GUC1_9BACI|nr:VanZ family protein [Amphibacillus marinus]SEN47324.1 VanZ like family protein [Amphibacillus marinus]
MLETKLVIFFIITFPVWLIGRTRFLRKRKRRPQFLGEIVVQMFAFYFLTVAYLTFEPFTFQIPFIGDRPFSFDTQLFYRLLHMAPGHIHLQLLYSIGNVLLFVPFGMLAPVIFTKLRHVVFLVFASFMFSLTIEMTQALFTLTRMGTVDDLFFNTLGGLLGYIIFRCAAKLGGK